MNDRPDPAVGPGVDAATEATADPTADPLDDFERRDLTFDDGTGDVTRRTYVAGAGPAVIVLTEMPGITPEVARFARWVRDAGFTVWMPSLFGVDGATGTLEAALETMATPCIRRELTAFAEGRPSPMVAWLRRLAAHAHASCGGPGVGAVGMCFTGGFALGMTLEPSVLAPVMCQPSIPLDEPELTFVRDEDLAAARRRLDADDLTVRAYRFDGDPYCPAARFAAFEQALGDRFEPRVLPDGAAAPGGWTGVPHSVVTTHLVDGAGQPTAQARDEIISFCATRLRS
ncbi:MAG: dienelactone hydrolase family protein [Actinomycetota bacterium]|nr:dienelactone hydrolase family protein [Actinomycetota bacterium]